MSDIKNYYKYIPADKKIEYHNPNKCKLVPLHPASILITGRSGNSQGRTGKTNLVLNIISKCNNYDRYYIFCKMLGSDPLYDDYLIPRLEELEAKYQLNILIIKSNTLDDLPDVLSDDVDPEFQNLFIFDDMLDEDKSALKKVESYFTKMRKRNCSMIFVTQNYFETPKSIRKNCQYFIFTNLSSQNELNNIYDDLARNDITKERFMDMFQTAVSDGGCFVIDLNQPDYKLKFRKNFSMVFKTANK
jgi:hypothetical protein